MFAKQNWEWLAFNSHYQTAVAVREALKEMEMGKDCDLTSLSWEEVFEEEYSLVK